MKEGSNRKHTFYNKMIRGSNTIKEDSNEENYDENTLSKEEYLL